MSCEKSSLLGLWITLIYLTQFAGGAWLRCYKGSLDNYVATQLTQELPSYFTSCLDPALPTVVYTFGYRGKTNGPATKAMLEAYINRKKRNVVLLDWEDEAKSGVLGIPLGYAFHAVPNAKKVGKEMGEALIRLHKAGMKMDGLHLVGHSLGAHIMGFAGKKTRETGHVMPRITGLDPARALFEGTFAVQNGLDRTCARFVDIIHSDPGGYGTSTSTGTVDIWPNYGSESQTPQPGCPTGDFDMFTPEDLCSHDRAWRYYVEAISSPTAFPAGGATDYESWKANRGQPNTSIYLGDLTNTRAQGNFYLTTNSKPEYGRGPQGMISVLDQATTEGNTNSSSLVKLLKNLR